MTASALLAIALALAAPAPGEVTVALGDLRSDSANADLAAGLTQVLRAALKRAPGVRPVERAELIRQLAALGLPSRTGATLQRDDAEALCKAVGAQWLVTGTLAEDGLSLTLSLVVFDPQGVAQGGWELTRPLGHTDELTREAAAKLPQLVGATGATSLPPATGAAELAAMGGGHGLQPNAELQRYVAPVNSAQVEPTSRATSEADKVEQLLLGGDARKAQKALKDLAKVDPATAAWLEGRVLAQRGKLAEAAAKYRAALALSPGRAEVQLALARLTRDPADYLRAAQLAGQRDPATAADALLSALAAGGPAAEKAAGLVDYRLLSPARAQAAAASLAKLGGPNAAYGRAALDALARGDPAFPALAAALAALPQNVAGRVLLADLLVTRGQAQAALPWLEDAHRLDRSPEIHHKLAAAQAAAGQLQLAVRTYNDILVAFPGDAVAERALGRLLLDLNDPAGAAAHLEKARTASPDDVGILRSLMKARAAAGDAPSAARLGLAVARLSPPAAAPDSKAAAPEKLAATHEKPAAAEPDSLQAAVNELAGSFRRAGLAPGVVAFGHERLMTFFSLREPDRPRLDAAVAAALMGAFGATEVRRLSTTFRTEDITADDVREVCVKENANYLAVYSVVDGWTGTQLLMRLYTPEAGERYEQTVAIDRLDATRPNTLLMFVAALVVALSAAWLVRRAVRGTGVVHLRYKLDDSFPDHAFNVLVSRETPRPSPLPEGGEKDFLAQVAKTGHRVGRTRVTLIQQNLELRLPAGDYVLTLYGVYSLNHLPAERVVREQPVHVAKGELTGVEVDLQVKSARVSVQVTFEGAPVSRGRVWVGDERRPLAAAEVVQGMALLHVPRGRHIIAARAEDRVAKREIDVGNARPQAKTIEIMRPDLNAAIELPEDDSVSPSQEANARRLASQRSMPPVSQAQSAEERLMQAHREVALARSTGGLPPMDDGQSPYAAGLPAGPPPGASSVMTPPMLAPPASARTPEPPPGAARTPQPPSLAPAWPAPLTPGAPVAPPSASMTRPGSLVQGRYRIERELGRGAMGVVYLAHDQMLDRQVAIKVIGKDLRDNPMALELFRSEARALAALQHTNIITVYDLGSQGGNHFLAMEYVDGQPLNMLLRRSGKPPRKTAVNVVAQACAGLAFAHEKRVIHRDIKPGNLMLARDGTVKLMDFGLARVMRELSLEKTQMRGTPLYMSPEQIEGRDVDFRADLYSLGCTAFELFTGRPPFIEGEILHHHLHTPPPSPRQFDPSIPPALEAVLMRALTKDKSKRQPSVQVFREEFLRAVGVSAETKSA